MKKIKGIIFAMAILSIIFMPLSTLATSDNLESNNISLMWDNERYIIPEIFVSGTNLEVNATVITQNDFEVVSGSIILEKLSSRTWMNVTSWPINSTGSTTIRKNYNGTRNSSYRIRITVTIDGERITKYSNMVTL